MIIAEEGPTAGKVDNASLTAHKHHMAYEYKCMIIE